MEKIPLEERFKSNLIIQVIVQLILVAVEVLMAEAAAASKINFTNNIWKADSCINLLYLLSFFIFINLQLMVYNISK